MIPESSPRGALFGSCTVAPPTPLGSLLGPAPQPLPPPLPPPGTQTQRLDANRNKRALAYQFPRLNVKLWSGVRPAPPRCHGEGVRGGAGRRGAGVGGGYGEHIGGAVTAEPADSNLPPASIMPPRAAACRPLAAIPRCLDISIPSPFPPPTAFRLPIYENFFPRSYLDLVPPCGLKLVGLGSVSPRSEVQSSNLEVRGVAEPTPDPTPLKSGLGRRRRGTAVGAGSARRRATPRAPPPLATSPAALAPRGPPHPWPPLAWPSPR